MAVPAGASATTAPLQVGAPLPPVERAWPVHAVSLAALAIVVGLGWDISWHRTIGRDTFWSPPHLLEQLAAIVAGVTCGWLVLWTTFRGDARARARAVGFWGCRGPLGAWVCIWGTLMMITSAPFDDWWHDAYGLDVRVLSPPHMVLALGMGGIQVGAMLMALARQNRAAAGDGAAPAPGPAVDPHHLGLLYLGVAAVLLAMHGTTLIEEAAFPNQMHGSRFYVITALFIPFILVALARPSRRPWPATTIAALYMAIMLALVWTLQLFPARPRLAPIFNPVTRMVPPPFPLLLVAPALAIDLLLRRFRGSDWVRAPLLGVAFVALMLAAHWEWAEFLLSPAARNPVFAADLWDYSLSPGPWRYEFWTLDVDATGAWSPGRLARGLLLAAGIATVSAGAGLWLGRGLARVQR